MKSGIVLMNQCTGSKLKEMKLLQFNSLGKSLDHYSSEEVYCLACDCMQLSFLLHL